MKSATSKVLHDILGWPVIRYVAETGRSAGVERLVVVANPSNAEPIRGALGESCLIGIQPRPRGTGDAVRVGVESFLGAGGELVGTTIVVLCGDAPLIRAETLSGFLAAHEGSGAAVSVLSGRVNDPTGYGRIIRENQVFQRIVEEADCRSDRERLECEINSGVLAFRGDSIRDLLGKIEPAPGHGELYLTSAVELARANGLGIFAWSGVSSQEILGINTRSQLAEATGILQQRIVERHMEAGVSFVDPRTAYIGPEVAIEADVTIHPCVSISGSYEIARGSSVGPFASLRGGGLLAAGARIGSFVEMVRSELGEDSRALHLAYLGDTKVGASVNIGAGTVFANWDGVEKHPGQVGEGASLGSGSIVIQPAKIGAGARTGAGAVVTRDIPEGETWVGMPAQRQVAIGEEK